MVESKRAGQLGKYLRSEREARGWSARDLAERSGVPDSTIVRIESGFIATPRPDKLSKLARALELSLAEVYGRAQYSVPEGLPTLGPYLQAKYPQLPAAAVDQIQAYVERVAKRHGVNVTDPALSAQEPAKLAAAKTRSAPRVMKKGAR